MTISRQRLHDYIDTMPEYGLSVVEPMLAFLANDHSEHIVILESGLVIETDLTEEEKAIIAAGEKEYEENPESFVNWDDVYNEYRSNKAAE